MGDGHSFEWDMLVPRVVHPLKVAIVEALSWIEEPLSAKELDLAFDEEWGLSLVAYHLRKLAAMGVVEPVRQEPVRGALQTFYALPAKECTGSSLQAE